MDRSAETAIKLIKRTDGRDKTFRILQYTALTCENVLGSRMPGLAGLTKLRTAMSTTRKALKLFRMLENVVAVQSVLSDKKSALNGSVSSLLRCLAAVVEVFYFYYDHLVWLHRVNLRPVSQKEYRRVDLLSSYTWLTNAVLDFAAALVDIVELRKRWRQERSARLQDGRVQTSCDAEKRDTFELDRDYRKLSFQKTVGAVKLGSDVITASCEANLFFFLTKRQVGALEGLSGYVSGTLPCLVALANVSLAPAERFLELDASISLFASVLGFIAVWNEVKR